MSGTVEVRTPVAGFTGDVAGVAFTDGRAEVDADSPTLRYFRQQGYGINAAAAPPTVPESVDPRTLGTNGDGIEHVGARLRDAAVDPRPGDFLASVNAGAANPHGPLVASPGIHGAPPAPIVPGAVSKDPAEQDRRESVVAEQVLVDGRDVRHVLTESAAELEHQEPQRPATSALKADWVTYATTHPDETRRLSQADAEAMTKPQLLEAFGSD